MLAGRQRVAVRTGGRRLALNIGTLPSWSVERSYPKAIDTGWSYPMDLRWIYKISSAACSRKEADWIL